MLMMLKRTKSVSDKLTNLIISPKITAKTKLTRGPEIATFKDPHFLSLKLKGFMGTGFAQPKIGPWPAVIKSNARGSKTEPMGSKCFKGFKVNLPAYFAVGSPR